MFLHGLSTPTKQHTEGSSQNFQEKLSVFRGIAAFFFPHDTAINKSEATKWCGRDHQIACVK